MSLSYDSKLAWFLTLTQFDEAAGFGSCPEDWINKAVVYFKTFEFSLLTEELQENGNPHLHGIFISTSSNSNLQRKIRKAVYGRTKTEKVPPNCIKLEKMKKQSECVSYVCKEEKILVREGFTLGWIKLQADLKFDNQTIFTRWKYIKIDQVPGLIIEYLSRNNSSIDVDYTSNKEDRKSEFITVLIALQKEGYNTRVWRKHIGWIFAEVTLRLGEDHQARTMWEGDLRFD